MKLSLSTRPAGRAAGLFIFPFLRLLPLLFSLLLLGLAWHLKHPLMLWLRHVETPLLLALAMAGLVWRGGFPGRLLVVLLLAVIIVTLLREGEYQLQRAAVLSGGDSMQAVGGHFIVGYTDFAEVKTLAARGLIGGIYLAKRNLRGRTLAEVAADIAELQAIRQRAGLPPLIVAGDQEGGPVSHLSPLLEAMPPLASLVGAGDQRWRAHRYGAQQGQGLSALGVNLNFGPVVDLRPPGTDNPHDRLTRLSARAIADDPATVGTVAAGYIDGLSERGVRATLKHFPGLGRVRQDTHLRPARLDEPPAALATDWQPFRQLASHPGAAIMLGHVTLAAIDPQRAASHSAAVVDGLLRSEWDYDGVLITDDLNMGAVYDLGVGRVASEALAAGIDLVLVSYDPRQVYRAVYAAAQALERGEIPLQRLQQSERRLADFIPPAETRADFRTNVKIAAPVSFQSPDAPADSRLAARKPAHAG
ncbi:glycoside hydrolase family 3 N-terminal domain-containing protein [Ferribacterium limneticum]|uniref:glycoside hydrolase family 3 N-terminal domain-containing protein n=1 Tax=Ferribacterium limneticum TaxID=76259 RepID=UPI001CFA1E34|nr:glycoside hydrolase family 3 N-terminal domain-containing protein [Ferribacterium limneticum]UCV29469.1 glycoside hydrolase family 3 protein [Ferribacterium limneticum]UCV33388.1 glycoside hydrolase family 3 protein [Ferribacterium limneticum]